MADGRHFENRKYAVIRPRIDLNFKVDLEITANLIFFSKIEKFKSQIWQTTPF